MRRYTMLLGALLTLGLASAVTPDPAGAQETPRAELSAETLIETARAALAKGELEDAEFLLKGIKPGEGNIDDLDFLYGSIAMARDDWQTAIARFRAMLIRDPTLPRVRLDLALAYFRAGEDSSAAYHFRQALGDEDLPPIVRARTLAFLDTIRRRKTWSVDAAVGIAPDSNINAATSSRQVTLFGLPAQLSEDARQTSGVGLNVNISAGYEARISPDLRFRTGASLSTRTYEKSKFNDRTLTLRAGPRFLFEKFDLRPELTARARHLSGKIYSRAAGIRLSGDWHVAPAWRLSGAVGGERDLLRDLPRQREHVQHPGGAYPCTRARHVAAGRWRFSPRGRGQQGLFVARVHRRGFGHAGAFQGVRGNRGIDLQVTALRSSDRRLWPRGAAGPDTGRADEGIEPPYRAVRFHARAHRQS